MLTARRIGVLGGTFDPFHNGHLAAAVNVRALARLDVVLLMVANDPWQKSGARQVSPAADRLALVEAGVAGVGGVEASDREIRRGGPSYTADTIDELKKDEPGAEIFIVVGTDLVAELATRHRVDDIRASAQLVVVARPGHPSPLIDGWSVTEVPIPALAISSTELRDRAAQGLPLDGLMPPASLRQMRERGMYAGRT